MKPGPSSLSLGNLNGHSQMWDPIQPQDQRGDKVLDISWIMVATIIPLLKAGKSPSEVASFRPISLTSCVVKFLERIIADRLYYIAETNNMFSRLQAGFCKVRSCEDQFT